MQGYIAIKDGWVQEVHTCEMGLTYDKHVDEGHIPVANQDLIIKLTNLAPIMFWDGKEFCQVKDPKAIWKRVRSHNLHSAHASLLYQKCIDGLDNNFPDVPEGTVIESSTPAVKKHYPPSFEYEFKPGLRICQSTEDDIDVWESTMVASGLYKEDEAWKQAAQWLSDPSTWNTKVVWKDKILQLENYHFGRDESSVVWNGFQTHLDRTRPQWFYKQMAKPLLQALYSAGIETVKAAVRSDRPDWADYLKDAYGSEILRNTSQGIIFRTKVKDALALIPEWPIRRTVKDWKFEQGGMLVREATEADIPALQTAVSENWGDNTRKEVALQRLEDMWELDSAAIILGFKDGKIINARMYRERKDPAVNMMMNPFRVVTGDAFKGQGAIMKGFLIWQQAVGYKTCSFFLETKLYNPAKDVWAKRGWVLINQTPEVSEVQLDVAKELNARQTAQ